VVPPVPAESRSRSLQRIPANRRVQVVQQKTVGLGQRKAVGVSRSLSPISTATKDALQIHIAKDQKRLLARNQSPSPPEKAQRLSQALLHLHRRRNEERK
jgi:hypothetical protein